jgi:hypothetical protein
LNAPNDRNDDLRVAESDRWSSPDAPLLTPDAPLSRGVTGTRIDDEQSALFSAEESDELRRTCESVQTGFVDEPRRAVEEADQLVQRVMDRLSDGFKFQREHMEREWGDRADVSTEDLRVALRHYRSFFDRLLDI